LPVLSAIDPVASAHVNPQLRHALAHRLLVAQIAGFNLAESGCDANLGHFVAKAAESFGIRFAAILLLVTDELDHANNRSIKATNAAEVLVFRLPPASESFESAVRPALHYLPVGAAFCRTGFLFGILRLEAVSNCEGLATTPWMEAFLKRPASSAGNSSAMPVHLLQVVNCFQHPRPLPPKGASRTEGGIR
jgi:hypothetical protein